MTKNEEFEKWAKRLGYADEFDVPLMKHAAYEGWNARQPEIDALKEEVELCRGTLESRDRNIETLQAEVLKWQEEARAYSRCLTDEQAEVERRNSGHKILGSIIHRNTTAMQAAWIEWKCGRGAEEAMQWIENTLDGPDLIPGEDEPHSNDAQAYFDAAMKETETKLAPRFLNVTCSNCGGEFGPDDHGSIRTAKAIKESGE